ncbi:UDP-N-acetylglucosamine 2-epimerase (non-hydrolysing) [Paucidesulfovibrio gracilis DSM 16080]|uniref:UDP-N-acetylglucosamine 2-epimerase (Non-hydrolysing) n=1 Tax=Paucidesulfovibrio gracilis DSM 16080 TaxID=1121449 RepID=A0A1T4W9K5_9BACT|nr:UDP-N-acetylglucosamine 2-epimerase (non-hydrolyzing) [Paucidesulfovibrio gracilis]SKA73956.1 UDP-N-acetylglucosamine 2-epimerase (non-hydrolysing) [Paucidesulfovibrio gracilis DSM 16080]
MYTVHLVIAARPNIMKVAPVYHALSCKENFSVTLLHTGQHYDPCLSDQLLAELSLPAPQHNFAVGSGSHAHQTAGVLTAYEDFLQETKPDICIVAGDVNSTLACALAAVKLHIPVAHIESGLRSRDRTMPEEINRILTDQLASILWSPSADADANLRSEGIPPEKISRVGNCMIDSLVHLLPSIRKRAAWKSYAARPQSYSVVTLHRPANVDSPQRLYNIIKGLCSLADETQIIFPVHPRTVESLKRLNYHKLLSSHPSIVLIAPLGYLDFLSLVESAATIITDSGGIQEETSYLGIPCLTLRPNTERPITCTMGTNQLVEPNQLPEIYAQTIATTRSAPPKIPLWDGNAGIRIAQDLQNRLDSGIAI